MATNTALPLSHLHFSILYVADFSCRLNFLQGNRKNGLLRFQLSDGLNLVEEVVALKVRVKDVSIHLSSHATLEVFPQTR